VKARVGFFQLALQITPVSSALSTARVRSRTPSLARMLDTWFFTVPSAVAGKHAELADHLRGKGGHGAEITADLHAEPRD
jgi:hypothetical protein